MHNPYKEFPEYIIRQPLYDTQFYDKLTNSNVLSEDSFKKYFENPVIEESIYLASPSLHKELNKWLIMGIKKTDKEKKKLTSSFLKYLTRLSTRCTPFGIFASCGTIAVSENNNTSESCNTSHYRVSQLDMNYLVALAQDLSMNNIIKNQLKFFPNTSIYKLGNEIRYVEYEYINAQRKHRIIAVENSIHLEEILERAQAGIKIKELVNLLMEDKNISNSEAVEFVEELVKSQFLISELEPSIIGEDFLVQIISVLSKLKNCENIVWVMKELSIKLRKIDQRIGNTIQLYKEIYLLLQKLPTKYNENYLFQTNLYTKNNQFKLFKEDIQLVKTALTICNVLTQSPRDTLLDRFKDKFHEKFGHRRIPLSVALDSEVGIQYNSFEEDGDINPLVDDLVIPVNGNIKEENRNKIHYLLQNEIIKTFKENRSVLELKDLDFKNSEASWSDLPSTISTMVEVLKIGGKRKIKCQGFGGSSGAKLMARFCEGSPKIKRLTEKITDYENKNTDKIQAEIAHLPESRIGNILKRPVLRNYVIPYLSNKKGLKKYTNINISDLYIFLDEQKKLRLFSKTEDREVVPKLTNAHNFSSNSLPIYHFLADMQTQGLRSYIGFNLSSLEAMFKRLPRIEYKNLIISEAIWIFGKKDLNKIIKNINSNKLNSYIQEFRSENNLPQYVSLVDGDNELVINFKNLVSVEMFIHTVKNRSVIKMKEFLYMDNLKNNLGPNQIIIPFYK